MSLELRSDAAEHGATHVDSRIRYPCYKSFDAYIDVERLKSFNGYITERVQRYIAAGEADFFLNEHTLDPGSPHKPSVREIWLSRTKPLVPYDYLDLNKPELWERIEAADDFALLIAFIETLPFKALGRMLIICDVGGNVVPAHRDHLRTDICHDFIWFRTNLTKPFYLLNEKTKEKLYVDSYSAWFDTVNQFHGSDARSGLSFSVRVDGLFSDELDKMISQPRINRASRPTLWVYA